MKACVACSKAIDDHATSCPYCGAAVTSPIPGVSWQPLTGGGAAAPGSAAGTATARVPYTPAPPPPPPPNAPGFGPAPLGAQAPQPQQYTPPFTPPAPSIPAQQPAYTPPTARLSRGKDMKPLIPRTGVGIIPRLEQARDQIYGWLEAYCNAKGIEPSLLKSTPFSPNIWVEYCAWNPEDPARTATDRSKLYISITGAPFHRYEILYEVTTQIGLKDKKHTGVCQLTQHDIERMMDLLLAGDLGKLEDVQLTTLRTGSFEFWRPKNEIIAIDHPFIDIISLLSILGFVSLVLTAVNPLLGIAAALGCWIAAGVISSNRQRRRWRFQNEGKPMQEPRILRRFDSWQALIFDLGKEAGLVRQEILAELRKGASSGFNVATETIWYWSLDGKEEREQVVARFRRGIAFVQIYTYGDDMFVGWDAHMNEGTWMEKEVARGLHQGRFVSLRTIEAGRQGFTEYDLFDTNCLVEWVHGAVVKVVKRKMAYHKIDQEIDFTIIRGDRSLEQPAQAAEQKTKRKLLKRIE